MKHQCQAYDCPEQQAWGENLCKLHVKLFMRQFLELQKVLNMGEKYAS